MALDPLFTAIATEIGKVVIKTVWDGSGKVLGMFSRTADEATQQLIFQASQTYVKKYGDRHGILKVLGMREPVKLEEIYAAVRFLDDRGLQSFESIESLEAAYRQATRRGFQDKDCPRQDGLTVANETQYLMVLGGPGAGKSTFLKRMGLEALKGKKGLFKHGCIPVLIELRGFNNREIDIENAIAEEFRLCGFPNHKEQTEKLLNAGKLLVLLDGLDEVATDQMNDAIRQIQNFVNLHDKNRFIASCRVAAYRHNFRAFTDVAMADFDDEQIQQFIANWFRNDPAIATACWEKLNSADHTAAKELTQTPLLLTLVCLLYQRSRKFPTNRATLYERALRVLLEEWAADEGKETHQEEIYKGLDTKRKEILLATIAHDAFQQNRLFLTRREIANQIENLLKEMLPDEKSIDGAAVLRSIEVQHGILVERAEGIYSFSHLTLQEYLTAQYIDDHRQIESLVAEHLIDQRWREVFILVAGLMRGGADDLLLQMETAAQQFINTDNLKNLLRWAEQATEGSEGDFKPAAKRSVALYLVSALNLTSKLQQYYSFALYRTLDLNLAFTLYHVLENTLDAYQDHRRPYTVAHYGNFNLNLDAAIGYDLHLNRDSDPNGDYERAFYFSYLFKEIKIFKLVNFEALIASVGALGKEIPTSSQPSDVQRAFTDRIKQIKYDGLHLNPDGVNLSEAEVKAFNNYLYANELIVRCKEAAVRVSPQVWAGIEERMLTIRE